MLQFFDLKHLSRKRLVMTLLDNYSRAALDETDDSNFLIITLSADYNERVCLNFHPH
jgi:hypothetical protein